MSATPDLASLSPIPPAAPFFVVSGTLPLTSHSYVTRQADRDLLSALLGGEYCFVLNSRQMGKSSLSVRTMAKLQEAGVKTAFLDLTKIGGSSVTPEQWFIGLLSETGRALGLRKEFLAYWKENAEYSLVQRYFGALHDVALAQIADPLVLFIDEIDTVKSLSFRTDEFFAAVRECYNRRVQEPEYGRLAFALVGSATASDLIQDTRTSPFNIGRRIELQDFTEQEVLPLAEGIGRPNATALVERAFYWTHGHPFLTQALCAEIAGDGQAQTATDVDRLVAVLFFEAKARERNVNLADVSNRILSSYLDADRKEEHRAAILDLYRQVWSRRKRVLDDETNRLTATLKLSGITRSVEGALQVRNRIYERVFDRAWVEQHLPDAERRRERRAFRRGLWMAGSLSGAVLLVVGSLGIVAVQNYRLAQKQTGLANQRTREVRRSVAEANYNLYVANMNLMQREWENNNLQHVQELLEATRKQGQDAYEWDYWNRLCHLDLMTLKGHTGAVSSVAFSPDGKRILSGSGDKAAKLWDAQTGKEILTLTGHTAAITSVAFARDGRLLVTGSGDRSAKVWDAQSGKALLTLTGHTAAITSVAFSPDGMRIVTGSADKTAKVWDAQSGQATLTLRGHTALVTAVAFSPDGKHIVTGSGFEHRPGEGKVWDAQTGKETLALTGLTNMVTCVAFSPDGKHLVTGGNDNTGGTESTASVWDAQSGKALLTLKGHTRQITSVAFSPDGKRLLTASLDNTAKVWNAQTGKGLLTLKGHTGWFWSAAFSPDGARIVTGSGDATVKVWDALIGKEFLTLRGHTRSVNSVAFSPDGKRFLTGSEDHMVKLWDAQTGTEIRTMKGNRDAITSVAFSPNGQNVVAGGWDSTAEVWEVQTGRELLTLKGHIHEITSVAFSPDGRQILTGSADGTAKVWDAQTGKEIRTIEGHAGRVWSATFSPDGKRIVFGCYDKVAMVWDLQSGSRLLTLPGHTAWVAAAAFSPDGKRILTGSGDNTAKIWDAQTGAELFTLKGHTNAIWSVAFSADGKRILTGSRDRTAKVWDAQTGKELLTLHGHTNWIWSAVFSADSKRVLTGSGDSTAKVW